MLFNEDPGPRGVVLYRIPFAGAFFDRELRAIDSVPFIDQGKSDARQWKADATTSQTWSWSTSVAQSPLADGSLAANHARRDARSVVFDALITDTPLFPLSPLSPLGGLPGVRRADSILAGLIDIWTQRSFVALVSPRAVYSTAMITNMSQPVSADDGSAYYVTITVQELRTFAVTRLASIDDAAAQLGAAKTSTGGVVIGLTG